MDEEVPAKANLAEARHAAKALLKAAGVTEGPVIMSRVLPHVSKIFHLEVKGTKQLPPGVDAVLHREPGLSIIGYNENVAPVRQKFSVAHELGHLHMGHVHGRSSVDLNSSDHDEVEANQFAAHLLMPVPMLRQDIKAGIKDVDALTKRYVVSSEAMWWQLSKSGLIKLL